MRIQNLFIRRPPVLLAIGVLLASSELLAQGDLKAAFDWSMPDRFGATDPDGKIHYRSTLEEIQAPPGGWEVRFSAAASTGDIASWAWQIDGGAAKAAEGPGFSHRFPEEGVYEVALTVSEAGGRSASASRRVVVQDWLIVAIGDSYGSGEGNPDIPIPADALNALQEALADLNRKQEALDAAIDDLADVQDDYDDTIAAARDVRAKLNAYNAAARDEADICTALPPRPVQCAEAKADTARALANLGTALGRLGLQGLIDTRSAIPRELDRLEDAAQAALDAAKAGVDAARAAADAAKAAVETARGRAVATWQDCPCHRSANAGQAQAALELEQADPRTSVTFLHLACSGATIVEGLIGAYDGIEPGCASSHDDRPQVDQIRDLVAGREIDALVTSIGGNDVYFSKIVEACMAEESCHTSAKKDLCLNATSAAVCALAGPFASQCREYFAPFASIVPSGIEIFQAGLHGVPDEICAEEFCSEGADYESCRRMKCSSLAEKYAILASYLGDRLPGLAASHVYLMGYPDLTRADDGSTCAHDPGEPLRSVPCLSGAETDWARDEVLARLNAGVADAAADHGWRYVAPTDAFGVHGYCAEDRWFVRLQDAFPTQGNVYGAIHPNVAGHRAFAADVAAALKADLYLEGQLSQPRHPADGGARFVRGDANDDGSVDLTDAVTILRHLFLDPRPPLGCLESADVDDNDAIDLTDPVRLLGHLFLEEAAPPRPYPGCGDEAGEDGMACAEFTSCSA
jgi:hypothetical protein